MITWLGSDLKNIWLRLVVTTFLFGWLIFIAWKENRNYRNITVMVTRQYESLKADHVRAEVAVRLLADQVLKNSLATSKSTEAVKKTTEAIKDLPEPR
jgi:hypothetical protein